MNAQEKKRVNKIAWCIALSQVLGGYCLIVYQYYGNYIMTDVAGLTPAIAAGIYSVTTIILTCWSLFDGAIVQRTRTKQGQFRPWYFWGVFICVAGGFLLYVHVPGSVVGTTVVVGLGAMIPDGIMDLIYTARMGIFTKMSMGSTEARTKFNSFNWFGTYISYVIAGAATIPLVEYFGKVSGEARGFMVVQAIFGMCCILGYMIIFRISKPYDTDNTQVSAQEKEQQANFLVMVKSVFMNKAGRILLINDILRFSAYTAIYSLVAYQAEYVIGDLDASSTVFALSNVLGLISSYASPFVADKLGRKTTQRLSDVLVFFSLLSICFLGKTEIGLTVAISLWTFFMGFNDAVDAVLYMDAGEYYLAKEGKDTRSYLNSMYNVAAKASNGIGAWGCNAALMAVGFTAGTVLSAAAQTKLTILFGVISAAFYAVPIILMFFYPMTDAEADAYAAQNLAAGYSPLDED